MAEAQASAAAGKLVIRNIGLLLSGDLAKPVLDADTVVAEGGRITAVGKAKDVDTARAAVTIDAKGTAVAPGLIDSHVHPVFGDWTPRQSQLNWIDSFLHGGVTTMISAGEVHLPGRPKDVVGVKALAITAQRAFDGLPARRGQGARRRTGAREGHGRERLQGAGGRGRHASGRGRARRRQGRGRGAPDGRLGAQIRHQQHDPHRRAVDPRLRAHRQGRGAGGRCRRDRPHQRRPYGACRSSRSAELCERSKRAIEIVHNGNERAALFALRTAREMGQLERVILGTDCPAGSGVQPLGILRMIAMLSSLGEVPAEQVFCLATGNTARLRKLDCGLIEVGRAADFVFMDRAQHSAGKDAPRKRCASATFPASAWSSSTASCARAAAATLRPRP